MSDATTPPTLTQDLLGRINTGDEAALDALLRHTAERLTRLTRRMLGEYARVRRWADTDDVLQSALMRLVNALRALRPQTAREYLTLAALQIRRELIDLARRYFGPEGIGTNHDSVRPGQATRLDAATDSRDDPAALIQWSELHQSIDRLPEEEREVVGLLFYQGLSQADAASILGISVRAIQRRWHDALCKLHRLWRGEEPG